MSRDPRLTAQAEKLRDQLDREARAAGYHLNPDKELTLLLCEGLLVNQERYGYPACPCRLAAGKQEEDLDIICPCDYRDPDLTEFGTCYCGLYVSLEVVDGKKNIASIPERRPGEDQRKKNVGRASDAPGIKVFRCKVCGYLCARESPPEKCPVCKAQKERFEVFTFT